MAETKTIAVIGATGAQGGGLVQAILTDATGAFAARAITRKPDSDKAQALAAAGAEVVAGDSDDPASLERAFAYTLIATAKLRGIDPAEYLRKVARAAIRQPGAVVLPD